MPVTEIKHKVPVQTQTTEAGKPIAGSIGTADKPTLAKLDLSGLTQTVTAEKPLEKANPLGELTVTSFSPDGNDRRDTFMGSRPKDGCPAPPYSDGCPTKNGCPPPCH